MKEVIIYGSIKVLYVLTTLTIHLHIQSLLCTDFFVMFIAKIYMQIQRHPVYSPLVMCV